MQKFLVFQISGDDDEKVLYRNAKNSEVFSGESFLDIRDGDRLQKKLYRR